VKRQQIFVYEEPKQGIRAASSNAMILSRIRLAQTCILVKSVPGAKGSIQ
jgi:hypothetical protein